MRSYADAGHFFNGLQGSGPKTPGSNPTRSLPSIEKSPRQESRPLESQMNTYADVEEIEVARSDLDPEYIQRRLADWKRRVDTVFTMIKRWAANQGATVENMPATEMNEDILRRHHVGPYAMSSLIVRKGRHIIKVSPPADYGRLAGTAA